MLSKKNTNAQITFQNVANFRVKLQAHPYLKKRKEKASARREAGQLPKSHWIQPGWEMTEIFTCWLNREEPEELASCGMLDPSQLNQAKQKQNESGKVIKHTWGLLCSSPNAKRVCSQWRKCQSFSSRVRMSQAGFCWWTMCPWPLCLTIDHPSCFTLLPFLPSP